MRSISPCLAFVFSFIPNTVHAIAFQSAPAPELDLSPLGQIAFAGSFDSLSLYNYVGQNEDGLHTNGSQSLLSRYPTGTFANLKAADAHINAMCPFVTSDGTFHGILVGGNFTSLGGQEAQAAALFDPTTQAVTPLPGLSGSVAAVYCDQPSSTVYIGGTFTGGNSSNLIAWTTGWTNLPFEGVNGPVSAITKLPNGHMLFAGSFTGIGNVSTPQNPDQQVVNVGSANITSGPNSTQTGYSDPRNIICSTGQTGPNSEWLLQDKSPGQWQANFGFGYVPTKLRLYQSQVENYGTKTWRFTAIPINGIMNFTYYDENGLQSCSDNCPLPSNNQSAQDFYFVNQVGMNGFRIDIKDWYGNGGGLGGIELFQNDIYSFAVQGFNEPKCDDVSVGSSSISNGNWSISPAYPTTAQYLITTYPNGTVDGTNNNTVVFQPDIRESGNYTVTIYTPGCLEDGSCNFRGQVNITGSVTNGTKTGTSSPPISTTVFQTNNYDKYDQVYFGYVDATSDSFKPSITLEPVAGQTMENLTIVAQRVRFELVSSTGGLNGLLEYDPSSATVNTDFSSSTIDSAGTDLQENADFTTAQVVNNVPYLGGNFSSDTISNIMYIGDDNATSLANGGLNAGVQAMYANDTMLYVGGNFTNTQDNSIPALANVASYDTSQQKWIPLGAGVNGIVWSIVPTTINISSTEMVPAIAVSGYFDQILPYTPYPPIPVQGLAVWVPSTNSWLQDIASSSIFLSGRLNAQTNVPGQDPIYAGTVDSQVLDTSNAAGLKYKSELSLQPLNISMDSANSIERLPLRKRFDPEETISGVANGYIYNDNDLNITILAGHFTATSFNGSKVQNLAFINGSNSDQVTGMPANDTSNASILAIATQGTRVFAGGSIENGVVVYDLSASAPVNPQPPPLSGANNVVYSIATKPSSSQVYFGGSFGSAGSLPCPALCIYDNSLQQWTVPGLGLSPDSIIREMQWASKTRLLLAGNMSINGVPANLVSYNTKGPHYNIYDSSSGTDLVPGPIIDFSASDNTYADFFVAGRSSSDGTPFISKFSSNGSVPSNNDSIAGSWGGVLPADVLGPATSVESLYSLSLTQSHAQTSVVDSGSTLMIMGLLQINGVGNASVALFNGTTLEPFIMGTMNDGTPGTISKMFVANSQNLLPNKSNNHLAVGFVVLIALAIALALIFLIVVGGIIAERIRKRREGYVPAPTSAPFEKGGNVGNISPERLFGGGFGRAPE